MKRIALLGGPGSGKSTFAIRLAKISNLPLVHIDKEFWLPDWREPSKRQWAKKHSSLITKDTWILDGGMLRTGEDRIARCDLVVLFDIPTHICLYRVLKRIVINFGKEREGVATGCLEKLDLNFLNYVFHYRANHEDLRLFILNHLPINSELVIVRSNADIENLLNRFKTPKCRN